MSTRNLCRLLCLKMNPYKYVKFLFYFKVNPINICFSEIRSLNKPKWVFINIDSIRDYILVTERDHHFCLFRTHQCLKCVMKRQQSIKLMHSICYFDLLFWIINIFCNSHLLPLNACMAQPTNVLRIFWVWGNQYKMCMQIQLMEKKVFCFNQITIINENNNSENMIHLDSTLPIYCHKFQIISCYIFDTWHSCTYYLSEEFYLMKIDWVKVIL